MARRSSREQLDGRGGTDDAKAPRGVGNEVRDTGGERAPVDRDPLGPLSGPHGEHGHPAQPRQLRGGRGDDGDRRRHPRRVQERAAARGAGDARHGGRLVVDRVDEGLPDDGELDRDVHAERPDRDPGEGVVRADEAERPRVPLGRVGEPGDELEDRGAHEERDRPPFEEVEHELARAPGWAQEESGEDRPELDEEQRDGGGPGGDVQGLGDLVEAGRSGGQRERRRRQLRRVAVQTGGERDGEGDAQPHPDPGRGPRTAQPARERLGARDALVDARGDTAQAALAHDDDLPVADVGAVSRSAPLTARHAAANRVAGACSATTRASSGRSTSRSVTAKVGG